MPSKVFGPTDSVADTLTQVGTTYQMPPGDWVIYKLTVGKGNVVNGTTNSGNIMVETVNRSYFFAYGNGQGGATNGHNVKAEQIECAIAAPGNTSIKVYVLDGQAAKNVTVAASFGGAGVALVGLLKANPQTFRTMAAGGIGGSGDTVAATEESMTSQPKLTRSSLQPEINGKIYQIRFAGTGIVDAKANSAVIKLFIPGKSGPYEYAVGNGPGGATLGGAASADVIDIPEGIPVETNATIDVKITSAEVMKSPVISLSYW